MNTDARLKELGLVLPSAPEAKGLYRLAVVVGGVLHTAGHLPMAEDGSLLVGRLGENLDVAAGAEAARRSAMAILATLVRELGSLDRVERVVRVFGLVQCTPDFQQQPAVLNGASQLFADVFGPEGIGVRSAVGTNALPLGAAVEVEASFQLKP